MLGPAPPERSRGSPSFRLPAKSLRLRSWTCRRMYDHRTAKCVPGEVIAQSGPLKVLPERFASDPERVARFRHEAQHLAALNRPNIVSIYGVEDANSRVALVMELVEGRSLNDHVGPKGMPLAAA